MEIAASIAIRSMVKASAGGGGKGMRIVGGAEFENAFMMASKEAGAAFNNAALYVEKFVESEAHRDPGIRGPDATSVHLNERDARSAAHQKLIEESPSRSITPELREKMGGRRSRAPKGEIRRGGTIGFSRRWRQKFLFHGDEYAHPGRTFP